MFKLQLNLFNLDFRKLCAISLYIKGKQWRERERHLEVGSLEDQGPPSPQASADEVSETAGEEREGKTEELRQIQRRQYRKVEEEKSQQKEGQGEGAEKALESPRLEQREAPWSGDGEERERQAQQKPEWRPH